MRYLQPYRDSNGNGLIDNGEDVTSSVGYSSNNISQILTPGDYFFLVAPYYNSTRYDLSVSVS